MKGQRASVVPTVRAGSTRPAKRRTRAATYTDPRITRPATAPVLRDQPAEADRPAPAQTGRPTRALPLGPALRLQQTRTLEARLRPDLKGELELTLTNNRAVMISVRRSKRRFVVRLHHIFVDASDAIVAALARYIERNDTEASREIGRFLDAHDERIEPSRPNPRRAILRTDGRVYDLRAMYDAINRDYFGGRVDAQLTWGRNASRGRARRSIKLGSFDVDQRLIRIHPGLDQAWVPRFYVEWVLYHEMLHVVHPVEVVNGRRRFHTAAFAADERRFGQYADAATWERNNVAALLCL